MKKETLYIYQLDDWSIGACRSNEAPPENTILLTTRTYVSNIINNILYDWNMTIPIQEINRLIESRNRL